MNADHYPSLHPFLQDFSYLMQVRENHYTKRAGVMGIRACAEGYNGLLHASNDSQKMRVVRKSYGYTVHITNYQNEQ